MLPILSPSTCDRTRRALAAQSMSSGFASISASSATSCALLYFRRASSASSAHMAAARYQLARLNRRRRTAPKVSPLWALLCAQVEAGRRARQYRRWIGGRKRAT